jgi:mono/diheme cytochrome c family protein
MSRVLKSFLAVIAVCLVLTVFVRAQSAGPTPGQAPPAPNGRTGGWTVPPGAADEKSPLTVNDSVVAAGKKLYGNKCKRCHGPEGKGDGPDADPAHANDMNLTLATRAQRNADGVVFYKIWNGRATPKMPKFSEEISKDQAWAIVAYVQTLRAKQ